MSVANVGYISTPSIPATPAGRVEVLRQNNAPAKPEPKTKPQVIHNTARDIQRIGNAFNKKLQFVVDHNSNDVIVKVIDKETDKVIRELPPKELQRLHKNLREAIGLLFDEMV